MLLTDLRAMKCKTCGEPLDLSKAQNGIVKCAICDSVFTLPKADASQKVLDFLSQGEHDLDTCRFDDAYSAFNKACELDKTEPEAYWGMALAEFKIQYLKDEVNNRLQPICHEISDKDFADSVNCLRALRYATEAQRVEYEKKSEEINYIKNEFNKIAKTGAKYDCFICVKVTDENGGRTQDYKHADDIYFELKGKGYKPFFSERELVGVTGADYEARILYALKSAECMLVVCFDEAYLRTKWVKNEYSRFLKLVNDEEKESDSIALVFGNRPIEKLPGKKGKIQGIALNSLTAMERIVQFVDSHTPEARKRREEALRAKEEEAKKKAKEDDALKQKLAEQESLIRQQAERFKQLEEMLKAQQNAFTAKPAPTPVPPTQVPLTPVPAVSQPPQQAAVPPAPTPTPVSPASFNINDFEIKDGVLIKYRGTSAEVFIPSGIKSIGRDAFKERKDITSVIIPNTVTSIGFGAFRDCIGLKSINIPYSVAEIKGLAFIGCYGIESITVDEYNLNFKSAGNCLLSKDGETLIWGCKNSVIPNSVRTIGDSAFNRCEALEGITIPNGVTKIGSGAFEHCKGLKSITIPSSVTSIGSGAFWGCQGLDSVIIPRSVVKIDSNIFYEIDNLKIYCRAERQPGGWKDDWNLQLRKGLNKDRIINSHTVVWGYREGIDEERASEPAKTRSVPSEFEIEFGVLKKYKGRANEIIIPDGVTLIDKEAFAQCSSITSVVVPNGVTSIGEFAFFECYALTDITLPNSLTRIESNVFWGCTALKSVVIPDSVTSIGVQVFHECRDLTSVTLPYGLKSISYGLFSKCKCLASVNLPRGLTSIDKYAFVRCTALTNIEIPNGVTSIGEYAFEGCTSLTSLTIPNSVKSIGGHAFCYCVGLTSVTVSNKLKSIEMGTFADCHSLTGIIIPSSVTSIGASAFSDCKQLKSIIIPEGVKKMGRCVFHGDADITIYCRVATRPTGWEVQWDEERYTGVKHKVVWGYGG